MQDFNVIGRQDDKSLRKRPHPVTTSNQNNKKTKNEKKNQIINIGKIHQRITKWITNKSVLWPKLQKKYPN